MEITSIKLQENGYLVNGTTSVPNNHSGWMSEFIEEWLETNTPEPEFTEVELIAKEEETLKREAKVAKQLALDSIVVEVNGHVFDARDKDQARIVAALKASEVLGVTTVGWKLANDTIVDVGIDTLTMVLALGIQEVGRIVKG